MTSFLSSQVHNFDDHATWYRIIYYVNVVFTVFFVVEALVKIFAFIPPVSSSVVLINTDVYDMSDINQMYVHLHRSTFTTFGTSLSFQLNSSPS